MKRRKLAVFFLLATVFFATVLPTQAFATIEDKLQEKTDEEFGKVLQDQLQALELEEFNEFLQEDAIFQGDFVGGIKKLLQGEFFTGDGSFWQNITSLFFGEIKWILPLFATISAITLLVSVLACTGDGFLPQSTQNVISLALILIVATVSTPIALSVANQIKESIFSLTRQTETAFPVLLTLVYTLGGSASSACFSPTLYLLSNVILKIVSTWIFPIFLFLFGLNIITSITDSVDLSGLSDFFLSLAKYILGISFTVFSAMMALQGISAGSFDSISYRTAKYAISNSIPMIGSYIKDGFDLILLSGILLKNAVGVGFVLAHFSTILSPAIKLLSVIFLFKLTGAISSTFAPKKITKLYRDISGSLSLILTTYIAVFFMYSIAVIMLVMSSNIII